MKATRIAHLAVATADSRDLLTVLGHLGLAVAHEETVADQGVRVQMVGIGPDQLEILQPEGDGSPISRFLAERGPGLHHLAIEVDDLAAVLAHLETQGVRLIDARARIGAGGRRIAFLHPASCGGVLVELCEREEPTSVG